MEQNDNNTLMSILTAIGGIVMSMLAAVGIVARLLVTGKASIISDVDMMVKNAALQEKIDRMEDMKTMKEEIISEIQKTNGRG
jgi:hypothetical protein